MSCWRCLVALLLTHNCKKRCKNLCILVSLCFASTGATAAEKPFLRLEESIEAMGTTYSIVLYGEDRYQMRNAAEQAFEEVRRLDQLLSNYRPESEWSMMNRLAAQQPVKVSAELFQLLSACQEWWRLSQGAFDISVGALMRVWGFYKGTGRLPHRAEIRQALERVGWRHVRLDPQTGMVHFLRSGVELDPGGIGKGYAVDRMVSILQHNGIRQAMVSAGGSSIYGLGAPPGEPRGWRVSIRDPRNPDSTIEQVFLRNGSLSTSGTYEKFFRAEGRIWSHIMDPRTGYPAQGMLSVSVLAPKTVDSEAWTKPVFINGRRWASKHLPAPLRAFVCEDNTNKSCEWLQ
jgi:thiamine biosynthesis lipoprotein